MVQLFALHCGRQCDAKSSDRFCGQPNSDACSRLETGLRPLQTANSFPRVLQFIQCEARRAPMRSVKRHSHSCREHRLSAKGCVSHRFLCNLWSIRLLRLMSTPNVSTLWLCVRLPVQQNDQATDRPTSGRETRRRADRHIKRPSNRAAERPANRRTDK